MSRSDNRASFNLSVMSSSSERDLGILASELVSVSDVRFMDLYLLRAIDLAQLQSGASALEYMSKSGASQRVHQWLDDHLVQAFKIHNYPIQISSLATFFPEIASRDDSLAELAINAIVESVLLANALCTDGLMQEPIVEIVCGATADHCKKTDLSDQQMAHVQNWKTNWKEAIILSPQKAKRIQILDRLVAVKKRLDKRGVFRWGVALELEPGSYVLNEKEAISDIFEMLLSNPKYTCLRPHVGLNLDIAHMKIAGVKPEDVARFRSWIMHSHICDHPGMHTRDQVLGTWEPLHSRAASFYQYLSVFQDSQNDPSREGRPHSNSVAIELEGCNQMMWIHNSVVALRRMELSLRPKIGTRRFDKSQSVPRQHDTAWKMRNSKRRLQRR